MYRSYEQPQPSQALVLDITVQMRKAIEASLMSGALFNTNISVSFRTDVYKYLLKDKTECNSDDLSY